MKINYFKMLKKQKINKARDWGEPDANGVQNHIKEPKTEADIPSGSVMGKTIPEILEEQSPDQESAGDASATFKGIITGGKEMTEKEILESIKPIWIKRGGLVTNMKISPELLEEAVRDNITAKAGEIMDGELLGPQGRKEADKYDTLKKIVSQLAWCGYECEGGVLTNNVAFIKLVEMSEADGPRTEADIPSGEDVIEPGRPGEEEAKKDFLEWMGWYNDLPGEDDPDYYTLTWGMNVWYNAMKFYSHPKPADEPKPSEGVIELIDISVTKPPQGAIKDNISIAVMVYDENKVFIGTDHYNLHLDRWLISRETAKYWSRKKPEVMREETPKHSHIPILNGMAHVQWHGEDPPSKEQMKAFEKMVLLCDSIHSEPSQDPTALSTIYVKGIGPMETTQPKSDLVNLWGNCLDQGSMMEVAVIKERLEFEPGEEGTRIFAESINPHQVIKITPPKGGGQR